MPAQVVCGVCHGPNQPGMNFCRHCGSPMHVGAMPSRGGDLPHAPTPLAPPGPTLLAPPGGPSPMGPAPMGPAPMGPAPMGGAPSPAPPVRHRPSTPTPPGLGRERQLCRRCGGHTALGFSFCQHCGAPLDARGGAEAVAETLAAPGNDAAPFHNGSPLGGPVGHVPMGVGPPGTPFTPAPPGPPPYAVGPPAGPFTPPPGPPPSMSSPTPAPPAPSSRRVTPAVGTPVPVGRPLPAVERATPWGTLISVRRDGSDGDRFALTGEWIEVGREADLSFDDRYLAGRHARFERSGGVVKVQPLDGLNGVFRRLRAPEPLGHGAILLLGRELLRFEVLEPEERDPVPLVRHGVTMFGSPARKPWGRLVQVLASSGERDVRHLAAPEVVLGREEGDLVFRDDEFLSRRHATLRWTTGGCVLEDLKSSNGSFVRLRATTTLASGDTLRMGDQMFRFEPAG